jgi:hypothetical protein
MYYILNCEGAPQGYSGESLGTKYDLGCEICGTPAKVIGDLHAKGLRTNDKKHFFETLDGDYLISGFLYDRMLERGINISQLNKAIIKNSTEHYYHFVSYIYFPQVLGKSKGLQIEDQCQRCRRNGFYGVGFPVFVPYEFNYQLDDKSILLQSDVFSTWEHFGTSNLKAEGNKVIRFARPLPIVSEKVKMLFEELGVKGAAFYPVYING